MAAAYEAEQNRTRRPMSFQEHQQMTQATYVARLHRRTMPPRCHPLAILLLVLAIGMAFIGITMTLIAHWPGATSIGENPLKIAGPVLFGVGGVLIIISIVLVAFCNNLERKQWDENLRNIVTAKLHTARDPLMTSDGDKSGGSGGRSTLPSSTGPSAYTNPDFDPSAPALAVPRRPGERGVDVLPDPSRDADSAVPQPVRVTKKRRSTQPPSDVSASDVSVSGAGVMAGPGMTSTLRGTDPPPPAYANLSYEADTPETERQRRPRNGEQDGRRRRTRDPPSADPIRDPVMRNMAAQQRQLRVHIKAQPGTAVHITPTATPPSQQAPAYHAQPPPPRTSYAIRTSASETEI